MWSGEYGEESLPKPKKGITPVKTNEKSNTQTTFSLVTCRKHGTLKSKSFIA